MAEVMSIAVSPEGQWLVVNGRPIEYYASDTAFVEGTRVWASERAARRLAEALTSQLDTVDFASTGYHDAFVTLPNGERDLVQGTESAQHLGLSATDPSEIPEEDVIILARELISRARSSAANVQLASGAAPVGR